MKEKSSLLSQVNFKIELSFFKPGKRRGRVCLEQGNQEFNLGHINFEMSIGRLQTKDVQCLVGYKISEFGGGGDKKFGFTDV